MIVKNALFAGNEIIFRRARRLYFQNPISRRKSPLLVTGLNKDETVHWKGPGGGRGGSFEIVGHILRGGIQNARSGSKKVGQRLKCGIPLCVFRTKKAGRREGKPLMLLCCIMFGTTC